jgi:hypothetical protein
MSNAAFCTISLLLCVFPAAGQTDQQIAALQQDQLNHHRWGYLTVSFNPGYIAVPPEDAARLEDQLSNDPENEAIRIKLLNYYWHNGLRQQRADSVFWLIEHHPESPILALDLAWLFPNSQLAGSHYGPMHDDADFIQARALWETALPTRLDVPEALHNAARFFEAADPSRSADLARRLEALDPQGHSEALAYYFEKVAGNVAPHPRQ